MVSNIRFITADIWITSPLIRQSFLLSSSTVFMFSTHMASIGPSNMTHFLSGVVSVAYSRNVLAVMPSDHCRQNTYRSKARFPFKCNRLRCVRCVRCVNENRKKRKRLRWQAANHGCPCFDQAFLLRFSFTQRTQRTQRKRLRLNGSRALYM